ncbi:MAG: PTS sugar transporter subunit IIA [Treponema sp.]|jgi:PTS system galactitol-specific IIA component|nr:PTS sugar transporter subunit IIA [Treponema sp.]
MNVDDILKVDCIIENLKAATKEEALATMGQFLFFKGYVKDSFQAAILERERLYPSGLPMEGHKIVIPHTDAEHVNESVILFAKLDRPVEFSSMGDPDEKIPVQLVSMFALKEKKQIGFLLDVLINTYSDNDTLDAILKASSAKEIYNILYKAVGERIKEKKEED